jgi:branched-chain amino acid transport system permease protein
VPSALLVSALALGVPFYTSQYWTFNVMVGIVLAISCLGLLVLVGWVREISLAQAGLTGAALYVTFLLEWDYDTGRRMPFILAAALGVAFVVAVSLVTALVAVRLAAPYVIVLTLSVQYLLEQTIFRQAGCLCEPTIDRPYLFGLSLHQDERSTTCCWPCWASPCWASPGCVGRGSVAR